MTIQYIREMRNFFLMKAIFSDKKLDRTKAIALVKRIEVTMDKARKIFKDYSYAPFDRRIVRDYKSSGRRER